RHARAEVAVLEPREHAEQVAFERLTPVAIAIQERWRNVRVCPIRRFRHGVSPHDPADEIATLPRYHAMTGVKIRNRSISAHLHRAQTLSEASAHAPDR